MSDTPDPGLPPFGDDSAAARRDGEPREAHGWLMTYLALPAPRSVEAAARQLSVSETKVRNASHKWAWPTRAAAFDAEQARARANKLATATTGIAGVVTATTGELTRKIQARVASLDPDEINAKDLAPLLRALSATTGEMARLSREAAAHATPPGTFGASPASDPETDSDTAQQLRDARAYLHGVLSDPAQTPDRRAQAATRLAGAPSPALGASLEGVGEAIPEFEGMNETEIRARALEMAEGIERLYSESEAYGQR